MRRAVRTLLVLVAVAGIVFLFVLPGRIWLAQGRAAAVAKRQDRALSQENAVLAQQAAQLRSPAYIEQLGRQEFGLVMPGEQAYAVLPATTPPTTAPPAAKHH